MARRARSPDFRYVSLAPVGAVRRPLALGGLAALTGTVALLASHGQITPANAAVCVAIAAGAYIGAGRPASGSQQACMAIVPWGVIVNPETEPRVLRWPGVLRVSLRARHAIHGGTPVVLDTVVTVDTRSGPVSGAAPGALGLEDLAANLAAYAEDAGREVALDLDGERGVDGTEPVVSALLDRARELVRTPRGAAALAMSPSGYRGAGPCAPTVETVKLLHRLLSRAPDQGPDMRPLAAAVAALVNARDLLGDLLELVSAPHPVLAAVARAAALRLGAAQSRAGAVDELALFLYDEDLAALELWARPSTG